jgi:putative nucleotidyltransferase with HDIG domain
MPDRLPQQILESVTSIPLLPLPQVLVRFLALAEDDRSSMQDLADVVALDPAFVSRLLTIAASPPFSRTTPPVTLEKSVAALGLPLLRILASSLTVQSLQLQPFYELNFDYPGFWCHSLRVASLAKSLAEAVGYEDPEEAYLSALLHDIGRLLLVGGVAEFGDTFPALSGQEKTELGARLVDSWQLSSFMSDAVLFHDVPSEQIGSANLLCRIVWSAHNLCGRTGEGMTGGDLLPDDLQIGALLGIEAAAVAGASVSSRAWATERAASLGLQMQMTEKPLPDRKYTYPNLTLSKKNGQDAARQHLEALVRNQAVMLPLQQSLGAISSEAELFGALRETARLLFGLTRPVFFVPQRDSAVLVAVDSPGQPPLLTRLEISIDQSRSLAAAALQTQQPCSSFTAERKADPSLIDIQLARLLGSRGLLCIPMGGAAQHAGVMVFGLSEEQYAAKQKVLEWMTGFARLAAGSLESFRALQLRDRMIAAELTRQFEQKARKVIHEAVNPLGIINNYLNIFAEKLGDADVQQELNILKEEIFRVERIVRRLNDQPERPLPVETVNINALIEGMLALYGESLFETRGIVIDKQLAPDLPAVRGDRDSLKQILFNLWKNSAEAMPTGGRLRIFSRATGKEHGDTGVEIRLSDSGPGIPPDVKERLFQPLSPDRRPDNSGVGLSIVASLVDRLGGQITCSSSPEEGTTFTIRFVQAQKEVV